MAALSGSEMVGYVPGQGRSYLRPVSLIRQLANFAKVQPRIPQHRAIDGDDGHLGFGTEHRAVLVHQFLHCANRCALGDVGENGIVDQLCISDHAG